MGMGTFLRTPAWTWVSYSQSNHSSPCSFSMWALLLSLSFMIVLAMAEDIQIQAGDPEQLVAAARTVNTAWMDPEDASSYYIVLDATTYALKQAVEGTEELNVQFVASTQLADGNPRRLSIIGQGAERTMLDCEGWYSALVFLEAMHVNITGVHFTGCTVAALRLADIYASPPPDPNPLAEAHISDCLFTQNAAAGCTVGAAGGIAVNGLYQHVSITGSSFEDNTCIPLGDSYEYPDYGVLDCGCASAVALYTIGSAEISGCAFLNGRNDGTASMTSSALNIAYASGSEGVLIEGTNFANNVCENECAPGALFVSDSSGPLRLMNTTFTDNHSRKRASLLSNGNAGAALFKELDQSVELIDCWFEGNSVTEGIQGAGAVAIYTAHSVVMSGCTFVGNLADSPSVSSSGAVLLVEVDNTVMDDTRFVNNTVINGSMSAGAFSLRFSANLSLTGCVFEGNDAGATGLGALSKIGSGGIQHNCIVDVVDSTFKGNKAGVNQSIGGMTISGFDLAGNVRATDVTIRRVSFENNIGDGDRGTGGAFLTDVESVLVDSCVFRSNWATGPNTDLTNNQLFKNKSTFQGSEGAVGGLQIASVRKRLTVSNSVFTDNSSPGFDGTGGLIILNAQVPCEISSVTFHGNSAPNSGFGGGLVIRDVEPLWMYDALFEGNIAGCNESYWLDIDVPRMCGGGAIRLAQSTVMLVNSTFRRNHGINGRSFGGAINLNSGAEMLSLGNTFIGNTAAAGGAIYSLGGGQVRIDTPIDQLGCNCTHDMPSAKTFEDNFPELWKKYFAIDGEYLPGSVFEGNMAFSGGALAVQDSLLEVSFSDDGQCTCNYTFTTFTNNRAYSGGAITSLRNVAATSISSSLIMGNSAMGPVDENGDIVQELLSCAQYRDNVIDFIGCGMEFGGGMCLSCSERCEGSITNVTFASNEASYGAGLYVNADTEQCADPDECYTLPVTGLNYQTGMGFFRHDGLDGEDGMAAGTQTNFTGNNVRGGAGAAMYLEHLKVVEVYCEGGKNASMMGGREFLDPCKFNADCTTKYSSVMQYLPCNGWVGNVATDGAFGEQVASSPTTFTAPLVLADWMYYVDNNTLYYSSGDPLVFNVSLWDVFGQEHVTEVVNPSAAMLMTWRMDDTDIGTTIMQVEAASRPGRLRINDTTFLAEVMSGHRLVRMSGESSVLRRTMPNVVQNVYARECKMGEYNPLGYRCLPCDVGSFNTMPQIVGLGCQSCPDDAKCVNDTSIYPPANNSIIVPESELFQSNPYSIQLYQCAWNGKACDYDNRYDQLYEYQLTLIRDPSLYNETRYNEILCDKGHSGVLCGTCSDGWGQTWLGCKKCIGRGINIFLYSLITVLFTIPLFAMLRAASTTSNAAISVAEDQAAGGMSGRTYLAEQGRNGAGVGLRPSETWAHEGVHSNQNSMQHARANIHKRAHSLHYAYSGKVLGVDELKHGHGNFVADSHQQVQINPVATICEAQESPLSAKSPASFKRINRNPTLGTGGPGPVAEAGTSRAGPVAEAQLGPDDASGTQGQQDSTQGGKKGKSREGEQEMSGGGGDGAGGLPRAGERPSFMGRMQNEGLLGATTAAQKESQFILLSATFKVFITWIQFTFMLDWIERSNPVLPQAFLALVALAQAVFSTSYSFVSLECTLTHFYGVDKMIRVSIINIAYPFMVYGAIVLYYIVKYAAWNSVWNKKADAEEKEKAAPTYESIPSVARNPPQKKGRAWNFLWKDEHAKKDDAPTVFVEETPGAPAALYSTPSIARNQHPTLERGGFVANIITAANITIFYFYQNWVQAILLIFICYQVNEMPSHDADGEIDTETDTLLAVQYGLNPGNRWYMNFNLVCFEGQHGVLTWTLGIPGLVFIVLCPILTAWWLAANCHKLDEPNYRSTYGFLYDEYREHLYAWESVIMFRKLFFSAVLMFLSSANYPAGAQVLSTLSVATAGLVLHIVCEPYSNRTVHNLDTLSQCTVMGSLFLSLYFVAPSDIPEAYIIISVFLCALNIIVGVIFLIILFVQLMDGLLLMAGLDPNDANKLTTEQLTSLMCPRMPRYFKWLSKPMAGITAYIHSKRSRLYSLLMDTMTGVRSQTRGFVDTVIKRNQTRTRSDPSYTAFSETGTVEGQVSHQP